MQGTPSTMQENPVYQNVVTDIIEFLQDRVEACINAGILRENIIVDPGFGFGKSGDRNYYLLVGLEELGSLGQPLLAGVSRKKFLGRTLASLYQGIDASVGCRGSASLAAATAAILAGAQIIRVHDVRPAREAAAIADAVLAAAAESMS